MTTRLWRAAALGASAVALGLGMIGCDECAGVPSCHGDATVSYSGRVIDFRTGRGTPGVTVVFRRAAGVPLDADSLVAVTDAEGLYRFQSAARGTGDVTGSVTVRPPSPLRAYTVDGVRLAAHELRGAGGVLPTLVAQPYVSFVGGISVRRSGIAAPYANVFFRRTGGAKLAVDSIAAVADESGYFYLQAPALETGAVTGDLAVVGGDLARRYVIHDVSLPVVYDAQLPFVNVTWKVGTSLDYALQLFYRGSNALAVGAEVEFRRTGGLRLVKDTIVTKVDADGRIVLQPVPAGEQEGEVVGDLTVRSPALRAPYVVRGVHLRTFDNEELHFAGVFGVGYATISVGVLRFRGDRTPLGDAELRFVRTGGLTTTPDTIVTRSLADGRFGLVAATDSAGEVVGDLLVRRDAASPVWRVPGLHLQSRGDDSLRFVGTIPVGSQLLYVGVLYRDAGGPPVPGWTVIFRRTGGIRLLADSLVSTTVEWGGFALDPATREEGTVEGTLEARSPTGDRVVRLGTVRLTTHDDDEVRLAGNWLLEAPAVRAP